MTSPARPPRLARRALEALLSGDPARRSILGDLLEEYESRKKEGSARADGWFVRQAIALSLGYVLRRALVDFVTRDLRFSARGLLREPALVSTFVILFGLGVAGSVTMFTLVDGVMLRPAPYRDSEELFHLRAWHRSEDRFANASYADFLVWAAEARSFASIQSAGPVRLAFTSEQGAASLVGESVSKGYFELFGVQPILGRVFAGGEDDVMVLSERSWNRRFGRDANVLGRAVSTTSGAFQVVGVLPARFGGLMDEICLACADVDFWIPASAAERVYPGYREDRARRRHYVAGRLAPGVSEAAARDELRSVAARLEDAFPESNEGFSVRLVPLHESWRAGLRPELLLLLLASVLLLLIANVNVAHLLLARCARRTRELAIRVSLGAGSSLIARDLLVESCLLAAAGGAVGLALSHVFARALLVSLSGQLPSFVTYQPDRRAALVAIGLSAACALAVSMAPFRLATRTSLVASLGGARAAGSMTASRWTGRLVTIQTALVALVLVHALLLARSYAALSGAELGFGARNLLVLEVDASGPRYRESGRLRALLRELSTEIARLPDGDAVTIAAPNLPPRTFVRLDVFPEGASTSSVSVETHRVASNFFRVLGIPLLAGRGFAPTDTETTERVAVVSASLAERFWPGEDPVGRRIREYEPRFAPDGFRVVGIVGDVRYDGVRPGRSSEADLYLSLSQTAASYFTLAARTGGSEGEVGTRLAELRSVLASVDDELPINAVSTVEDRFADERAGARLTALTLGGFAVLAFIVATLGVYGVTSYSVSRRRREIGVRLAMGGSPRLVVAQMAADGSKRALVGLVVGVSVALVASGAVSASLHGVKAWDPPSYLGAFALLLAASLLASYLPARRAGRVDPMRTLRAD